MKVLIIQTAHIGDVILALPVAQQLKAHYPDAEIHFLLRKGCEGLLENHTAIDRVFLWDKSRHKYRNLFRLIRQIRAISYDRVINLQRFFSSGIITLFSKAQLKCGFDKNPLSPFFDRAINHRIGKDPEGNYLHEVERNLQLVADLVPVRRIRPALYPSRQDYSQVESLTRAEPYIVVAPASVWYTKQYPATHWASFIQSLPRDINVFLIGGKNDFSLCERIIQQAQRGVNLADKLTLLQSCALIGRALRLFANDSAPVHMASAMNTPVTVIYCSTVPEFGFTPLSDDSVIIEYTGKLTCRPCGLHGHTRCPQGHFKCGYGIPPERVVASLKI